MNSKKLSFALFLFLLISLSACSMLPSSSSNQGSSSSSFRSGSEGISLSFVNTFSREIVVSKEEEPITLSIDLKNRGAYPETENDPLAGVIWLSGFDPNIIRFDRTSQELPSQSLENSLIGKSSSNPVGGVHVMDFEGKIDPKSLNEGRYSPRIIGTICYRYETLANPQVCIERDPLSLSNERPLCTAKDSSLGSQGGPIAVTKIEQTTLTDQTQFKITIKNIGRGEVFSSGRCSGLMQSPSELRKNDLDRVTLESVTIGGSEISNSCKPIDGNIVRLIDGTGFILCSFKREGAKSASSYATPLSIRLSYDYKESAEKQLLIYKLPPSG